MSLEAFKSRVLPVKNKLYRFAYRLLGDDSEAQDVVQEVLIKVWDRHDTMDELENMEAWCMRVTRNLSYDKLKSRQRRMTDSFEEGFDIGATDDATPYKSAETKDTMRMIRKLMERLPDKQRHVMQLRDIEGYSYKEIGDILELDMSQVKVNLFRARKQIREHLINTTEYGLQ
ncbi:RNA polymerase sigma factor [Fulvivirga sedimenti]|uniref:RNA polymerase sigma factor n=1 Tax=Fulvivirga sedimenti TaxID=2879465 RepID=A0A9X1KYK1_9BACT|nr:RNA polymerase sigma factor [Fulvivirga sedimenti]MCA6073696.1 RNA polymerase sigma factor [Fulvivirga sedimenti]